MNRRLSCKYCTGDINYRKPIMVNEFLDEIYINGNNNLVSDDCFELEDTKINYCPMCGRKL